MATILIVDDECSVRAVIRAILEDEGYPVLEAANGQTALAVLASSTAPLVVVLDMRLPDMDGLALLAIISEIEAKEARGHALIFCTAGRMKFTEDARVLLERMRATLLPQPFEIDDLLFHVASAARRLGGV